LAIIADFDEAFGALGLDEELEEDEKCAIKNLSTDLSVEGQGGIDTLTLRAAEGETPEWVGVVTSDDWAKGEMTIDASEVSAEKGVVIYAAEEKDADLNIVGSATSRNLLIGGNGSDVIKG